MTCSGAPAGPASLGSCHSILSRTSGRAPVFNCGSNQSEAAFLLCVPYPSLFTLRTSLSRFSIGLLFVVASRERSADPSALRPVLLRRYRGRYRRLGLSGQLVALSISLGEPVLFVA